MAYRNTIKATLRGLERDKGCITKAKFACCSTCGWKQLVDEHGEELDEVPAVCFYHDQDDELAFNKRGKMIGDLYLAWSGDGDLIVQYFENAGFKVEWNGRDNERICIKAK